MNEPLGDPPRNQPPRPNHSGTQESPPGTPRWVLLVGIALVAVVLAAVILLVVGGHDPSRVRH